MSHWQIHYKQYSYYPKKYVTPTITNNDKMNQSQTKNLILLNASSMQNDSNNIQNVSNEIQNVSNTESFDKITKITFDNASMDSTTNRLIINDIAQIEKTTNQFIVQDLAPTDSNPVQFINLNNDRPTVISDSKRIIFNNDRPTVISDSKRIIFNNDVHYYTPIFRERLPSVLKAIQGDPFKDKYFELLQQHRKHLDNDNQKNKSSANYHPEIAPSIFNTCNIGHMDDNIGHPNDFVVCKLMLFHNLDVNSLNNLTSSQTKPKQLMFDFMKHINCSCFQALQTTFAGQNDKELGRDLNLPMLLFICLHHAEDLDEMKSFHETLMEMNKTCIQGQSHRLLYWYMATNGLF